MINPAKPKPKEAKMPEASSAKEMGFPVGEKLIEEFARQSLARTPDAPVVYRPFFMRRGPMENTATVLIALGFVMMFQPFVLSLYSWSFITMLAGTAMFIIVSKFPE